MGEYDGCSLEIMAKNWIEKNRNALHTTICSRSAADVVAAIIISQ